MVSKVQPVLRALPVQLVQPELRVPKEIKVIPVILVLLGLLEIPLD